MNVKQIYSQMDKEDKDFAQTADFEGLKDEITDTIGKYVDKIHFQKANYEEIAKIYATLTAVHDVLTEGHHLMK